MADADTTQPVLSNSTGESVNASAASISSPVPLISLVADETYTHLKGCFLPGRGKPPALLNVCLTNRLLLQLKTLQAEGNKTSKVLEWDFEVVPVNRYCMVSAVKEIEQKYDVIKCLS